MSGADISETVQAKEAPKLLSERYELLELIASGGMGHVYKARHLLLNKEVAIKTIRLQASADKEDIVRFVQEAQLTSSLRHANIVQAYDLWQQDGQLFLAMDLLEGEPLSKLIQREGALAPAVVLPIFLQVCDALAYAHSQGVIHRDLKPSNVMLLGDLNEPTVKVLDFGIAKSFANPDPERKLTKTGVVFGTPDYMSPEQCLGYAVDQRSDIYALGCMLYEALTGRTPFDGNTMELLHKQITERPQAISELAPGLPVPAQLDQLVLRLLSKEPDERPSTMEEVKQLLEAATNASGSPGKSVKNKRQPIKEKYAALRRILAAMNRNRLPSAIAAVAAIAVCLWWFVGTIESKASALEHSAVLDKHYYKFSDAAGLFKQAIDQRRLLMLPSRELFADYWNYAICELKIEDRDTAQEAAKEAIALSSSLGLDQALAVAECLEICANVAMSRDDLHRAKDCLEQALHIRQKYPGVPTTAAYIAQAHNLQEQIRVYRKLRDLPKWHECAEASLKILLNAGPFVPKPELCHGYVLVGQSCNNQKPPLIERAQEVYPLAKEYLTPGDEDDLKMIKNGVGRLAQLKRAGEKALRIKDQAGPHPQP